MEHQSATKLHLPQRTCLGCHKRFDQDRLLAITRLRNGTIVINPRHQFHGRSGYICKNMVCFAKAGGKKKKKSALQYWLKVEVPENLWDELENLVKDSLSHEGDTASSCFQ